MTNIVRKFALVAALTAGCSEQPTKQVHSHIAQQVRQPAEDTLQSVRQILQEKDPSQPLTKEKLNVLWKEELRAMEACGTLYVVHQVRALNDDEWIITVREVTGFELSPHDQHSFIKTCSADKKEVVMQTNERGDSPLNLGDSTYMRFSTIEEGSDVSTHTEKYHEAHVVVANGMKRSRSSRR